MPCFGKHTRRRVPGKPRLNFCGQAIQLIQARVAFASPVICFGLLATYRFLMVSVHRALLLFALRLQSLSGLQPDGCSPECTGAPHELNTF